jgi:hypothetical protein
MTEYKLAYKIIAIDSTNSPIKPKAIVVQKKPSIEITKQEEQQIETPLPANPKPSYIGAALSFLGSFIWRETNPPDGSQPITTEDVPKVAEPKPTIIAKESDCISFRKALKELVTQESQRNGMDLTVTRHKLRQQATSLSLDFMTEDAAATLTLNTHIVKEDYEKIGASVEMLTDGRLIITASTAGSVSSSILPGDLTTQTLVLQAKDINAIAQIIIKQQKQLNVISGYLSECFGDSTIKIIKTGPEKYAFDIESDVLIKSYSIFCLLQSAGIIPADQAWSAKKHIGKGALVLDGNKAIMKLLEFIEIQNRFKEHIHELFDEYDPSLDTASGQRFAREINAFKGLGADPNAPCMLPHTLLLSTALMPLKVTLERYFKELKLTDYIGSQKVFRSDAYTTIGASHSAKRLFQTNLDGHHLSALEPVLKRLLYLQSLREDPRFDTFFNGIPSIRTILSVESDGQLIPIFKAIKGARMSLVYDNLKSAKKYSSVTSAIGDISATRTYQEAEAASLSAFNAIIDRYTVPGPKAFAPPQELPSDFRGTLYSGLKKPGTVAKTERALLSQDLLDMTAFLFNLLETGDFKNKLSAATRSEFELSIDALKAEMATKCSGYTRPGSGGAIPMTLLAVQNLEAIVYNLCVAPSEDASIIRFCEQIPQPAEWHGCAEGLAGKLQMIMPLLSGAIGVDGDLLLSREGIITEYSAVKSGSDSENSMRIPTLKWALQSVLGLGSKTEPSCKWDLPSQDEAYKYVYMNYSPSLIYGVIYRSYADQLNIIEMDKGMPDDVLKEIGVTDPAQYYDYSSGEIDWIKIRQELPEILLNHMLVRGYLRKDDRAKASFSAPSGATIKPYDEDFLKEKFKALVAQPYSSGSVVHHPHLFQHTGG